VSEDLKVQVCWEKFCRYWDVEARTVPVGDGATHLTPERAAAACDERTIGVVAILGSVPGRRLGVVAHAGRAPRRARVPRGLHRRADDRLRSELLGPGAPVVAQYFNLVRLGRDGYRRVQQDCRDVASWLAEEIAAIGPYELLSHGRELPVLAFRLRDENAWFTVYDVSERIRTHGWIVPAYRMPEDMEDVHVLRVVVRNGFSQDLAGVFAHHLREIPTELQQHDGAIRVRGDRTGFHH
jgi:glutamate/tyrosine decarboxylase-like PLP-dependent enzyme